MRTIVCLSFLLLAGCGSSTTEPTEPTESSTTETSGSSEAATGCDAHADCASCLAGGCNWTGGTCASVCLMDVSCFGPGNSHSPSCPEQQPEESTDF